MGIIALFSYFRNLSPASGQKMEGARGGIFCPLAVREAPPLYGGAERLSFVRDFA